MSECRRAVGALRGGRCTSESTGICGCMFHSALPVRVDYGCMEVKSVTIPLSPSCLVGRVTTDPQVPYTQRVWNVWVKASPQPLASIYPKSLESLGGKFHP